MKVKITDIIIPQERARSRWSEEQKAMLEGAITSYGQLSDPLVRLLPDGKYELIDGESRLRQFTETGIEEIEVKVVDLNNKDASLVNVLMNIARGEQDPMGIALAFQKAIDEGLTEEDIAAATRHSREWVRFHLNLNIIPEVYQDALKTDQLKVGHVKQAFRLPSPAEQAACLNLAITQNLNVNVISNYVDNILAEYEANRILQEYISVQDTTPRVDTQKLIHTTRCLSCRQAVPSAEISHPVICETCYALLRAIAPLIPSGIEGLQMISDALALYHEYQKEQAARAAQPQYTIPAPQYSSHQPHQVLDSPEQQEMIVKPVDMPVEEWNRLKNALHTRHGN